MYVNRWAVFGGAKVVAVGVGQHGGGGGGLWKWNKAWHVEGWAAKRAAVPQASTTVRAFESNMVSLQVRRKGTRSSDQELAALSTSRRRPLR
jgi:hypothetical protein